MLSKMLSSCCKDTPVGVGTGDWQIIFGLWKGFEVSNSSIFFGVRTAYTLFCTLDEEVGWWTPWMLTSSSSLKGLLLWPWYWKTNSPLNFAILLVDTHFAFLLEGPCICIDGIPLLVPLVFWGYSDAGLLFFNVWMCRFFVTCKRGAFGLLGLEKPWRPLSGCAFCWTWLIYTFKRALRYNIQDVVNALLLK